MAENRGKLTLEDLTYGLMLKSGNDAAVAIAEYLGGSVDAFALLMNKKAREIVSTKTYSIPMEGEKWDRALKNHNKLLWRYEGCNGVKTGA